jgi:hypothetical protein
MTKTILAGIAASALLAVGLMPGSAHAQNAGVNTKAGVGTAGGAGGNVGAGANASPEPNANQRASSNAANHTGTHSGANPTVGAAPGHSDPSRTKADLNGKVRGTGSTN